MLDMASVTSLLPYLLVAGYGVLLTRDTRAYAGDPAEAWRDRAFSWAAVVYVLVMFLAAGVKYLLLVTVLLAPGTLLYVWSRREQRARLFTRAELAIFAVVMVAALIGTAGLLTGRITP